MIIGLTGTKASGKGIITEILKERGFVYSSTSDRVREEAIKRGIINYTTKDLQDIGNDLRERFGLGILVKLTLEKLKDKENCVIDGIRNLGEIEELRKLNAIIIGVDAPLEVRYRRLIERNRDSDPKTWEDFLEMDKRDKGINELNSGQQVAKCIEASDLKIENNGTLEELKTKLEYLLMKLNNKKVEKRKDYLSWDEYFMGISLLSAQRSKDPNTQVGACIVDKKKKIIGIGYNGFPQGCSDDNLPWNKEGEFLNTKYPYVCHAELNAILNSIKDLEWCSIYVVLFPCNECAKAIIQSGIKEVVYLSDKYENTDQTKAAKNMFNQAGIKLRRLIINREPIKINFNS
jgi:dCMP deaminase